MANISYRVSLKLWDRFQQENALSRSSRGRMLRGEGTEQKRSQARRTHVGPALAGTVDLCVYLLTQLITKDQSQRYLFCLLSGSGKLIAKSFN